MTERARYVIVSDADAPTPAMVCQWVDGVGYCYLDRRRNKPDHDGMQGDRATPIEAFGFSWNETASGIVSFWSSGRCTAKYSDGESRRWQSPIFGFRCRVLKLGVVPQGRLAS
jgi:hypothetical protein